MPIKEFEFQLVLGSLSDEGYLNYLKIPAVLVNKLHSQGHK